MSEERDWSVLLFETLKNHWPLLRREFLRQGPHEKFLDESAGSWHLRRATKELVEAMDERYRETFREDPW